jgi:hypothetical protein
MSLGRTNRTGIAVEQRLWRRIASVAGAILIGLGFSVPVASATLIGEAADTVGSTVESVDATTSAAPSLPSAMPPATPPAAVTTPASVRLQTEAAATPSPSPSSSGLKVPSVGGIVSAGGNSVGSVTSTGRETTQRVAASARNDGSRISTPKTAPMQAQAERSPVRSAPRPARVIAIGTPSSAPPSIKAAEVVALQRWFARIWPAIPLGGGAGREWTAGVIGDLFRPAAAATARLRFLAPLAARVASDSPLVGHPATANGPQLAPPNAPASAGGTRVTYLIILAALLALLAFTIWREFRSALRPGVRW